VRVLLLHPARHGWIDRLVRLPPLGLACVAGALRAAGHDVRLLDAAVQPRWERELGELLSGWRPQVVGLSAAMAVYGPALALAARVRQSDPAAAVILGGVHATLFPGEVLRDPHFDYAVHGEGEQTAVELLSALAGREPVAGIAGIAFRDTAGPRVNPARPPIADLDTLPRPAYDLLPMGLYSTPFSAAGTVTAMVTSRGCPYPCTFCDAFVVHGRSYRAHSAERVVAEVRDLVRARGIREVHFKDSEFTIDRARVVRFCDLMTDGGPRVTWTCSARVDRVDAGLLEKMAAAGCRVIQFGVESADPAVLAALRKGIAAASVREAFRAARAAGIETVANLMVGSPGETWLSIEATQRLLAEIRPDHLNVQALVPYPGTALFDTLGGRPPVPHEEAQRRRRAFLRSFYLRPGRIAERVFTTSPRAWRENAAAAAELLGLGTA
jgi:anaerobic magnesium-protoporphyrin IX monomethyl ester cyclase